MTASNRGERTGAKALVESLERAGVEFVFGYPGGNVVDIFDQLDDARFRFVAGRHEQGCVHMADGYARATGRPGVALVTSGPGATNAITGLATANMDGVPLVLISGQVPLSQIGTDAFQEADMTGICRAVTKHSFLVQSADEIPETVAEAFHIATRGKPGAVVIDLPRNVQREMTSAAYPERISLRAYHPEHAARPGQIGKLAKLINAAQRPVLLAGGGVIAANAAADVAQLAHRAQIPVVTTLMGTGSLPGKDPLALGMSGMYGNAIANAAVEHCDLLVALGVRFNDRVTAHLPKAAKIAHVDCDPSSIDKNVTVDLGIVADVKDVLTTVGSRVRPADHGQWLRSLAAVGDEPSPPPPRRRPCLNGGGLDPDSIMKAIAAALPPDAALVTDVGQHQMWCARHFAHLPPRRFLTSGGMGTMGFAIPAAIGAAFARPGCRVVAVVGDGGAQMTAEELLVAALERLPIVFVVVNNRRLGMVRQLQDEDFGCRHVATELPSPDFVALANAYGLAGTRLQSLATLKDALAKALAAGYPVLIEVQTDPEADV